MTDGCQAAPLPMMFSIGSMKELDVLDLMFDAEPVIQSLPAAEFLSWKDHLMSAASGRVQSLHVLERVSKDLGAMTAGTVDRLWLAYGWVDGGLYCSLTCVRREAEVTVLRILTREIASRC